MSEIEYLVPAREDYTFNRGFVLSEDGLRAILRIIQEHFPMAETHFIVTENFRQHHETNLDHVLL